eukprot:337097-Pelagomonas_calceolata.AAC.1
MQAMRLGNKRGGGWERGTSHVSQQSGGHEKWTLGASGNATVIKWSQVELWCTPFVTRSGQEQALVEIRATQRRNGLEVDEKVCRPCATGVKGSKVEMRCSP